MAEYIMEAKIRLHIRDAEDEYDGWNKAMEFFQQGLNSLAYSDNPEDDHYEIEDCKVLNFEEC